tara:strand:+ start:479 stop:1150 length:672 start_codon:yes stop_codon:yes gene_type:complete
MKKLLLAILITFGSFSIVSADLGLNLGVSASLGEYEAIGSEVEDTETSAKHKEKMLGGMASIFIEKELTFLPGPLKRLTIGYDKVMHDIATGTKDTTRIDEKADGQKVSINQKVSADISNINTLYLTLRITDWLYLKGGEMNMDVATTESLGTGSSYNDTTLDGTVYGFGLSHKSDNGMFFRAEYTDTSIDGVKLASTTNSANSVTLDSIEGTQGRISIGRSF